MQAIDGAGSLSPHDPQLSRPLAQFRFFFAICQQGFSGELARVRHWMLEAVFTDCGGIVRERPGILKSWCFGLL
jgi:hypothetical protein